MRINPLGAVIFFALLSFFAICSAIAGVPDPAASTVYLWDDIGQVVVSPGPIATDEIFVVNAVIRDADHNPVVDAYVELDLSDCSGLCIDSSNSGLSGITDEVGEVQFKPQVGGCSDCSAAILADGIVIRSYSKVVSPDWDGNNGDGLVCQQDFDAFSLAYQAGFGPCFDYDNNGNVGANDFIIFNAGYGCVHDFPCDFGHPDPSHCSITNWDDRDGLWVVPGGGESVTVTIRDMDDQPVPNAWVELDVSDCDNLCVDSEANSLGVYANSNGQAVLAPHIGGCEECQITVMANCTTIRTYSRINSPDWDGSYADGVVCINDVAYLQRNYMQEDYCADITGEGEVTLDDFILLAGYMGAANDNLCDGATPDSELCSVEPCDTNNQVLVCPGLQENGLDDITIEIHDQEDQPIKDAWVEIDFGECEKLCDDGAWDEHGGLTDENGVIVIDPLVGGCEDCTVIVRCNCEVIRTFDRVVSPDWNGSWANGRVDEEDGQFFTYALSVNHPCGDYNGDGLVDTEDGAYLAVLMGSENDLLCSQPVQNFSDEVTNDLVTLDLVQNPGVRSIAIRFSNRQAGRIILEIFDMSGRLVQRILDEQKPAGTYTVQYDSVNMSGMHLSHGVYFVKLNHSQGEIVRKAIIIK